MSLSIFHRFTGLILTAGSVLLALWLFALSGGPENYAWAQGFVRSWIGTLVLLAWSLAFFYHLCNGIRHLFWDTGRGFELPTARASATAVVVISIVLTIACWIWAFSTGGVVA